VYLSLLKQRSGRKLKLLLIAIGFFPIEPGDFGSLAFYIAHTFPFLFLFFLFWYDIADIAFLRVEKQKKT
jgi:hypothetical protein